MTTYKASELTFDIRNPRLVEFEETKDETVIVNRLWVNMAVNEIVMSILANGFFENEAMYGVEENGKITIIEGNRRLAAVRAILNPDIIQNGGMNKYKNRITPELVDQLTNSLPVIVMERREDAWRYIGFKHVNGAVKWDSFAKAEYIAQVHNDYGISLTDIAEQIGDTNKITLKLYQGLMVLRQAESCTSFKRDDVFYKRLFFSHLYTSIGYEGFQRYLNLDPTVDSVNPIPEDKYEHLEDVMTWIFGSRSRDIKPVVKSQNPDIRRLDQVLRSTEAVQMLKASDDFNAAFETSQDGRTVLYDAIMNARMHISKALSKLDSYDGDEDLMNSVMGLANQTDALFDSMKAVYKSKKEKKVSERSLD